MELETKPSKINRPIDAGAFGLSFWTQVVVITFFLIAGLVYAAGILIPLSLALLLFVLIAAIVDRVRLLRIGSIKIPNWLAHIISLAIVTLGLLGILSILSSQAGEVADAFPRYEQRFSEISGRLVVLVGKENYAAAENAFSDLHISELVGGAVTSAGAFLGALFLVLLYLPFMLVERSPMNKKLTIAALSLPCFGDGPEYFSGENMRTLLERMPKLRGGWIYGCTIAFSAIGLAQEAVSGECTLEGIPILPDMTVISAEPKTDPAAHCRVVGNIGTDIGFELLLPDDWNGKFVMGGGGGFSGNFSNAVLAFGNGRVLQDGWATVTTDTGHKGNGIVATWALNNLERQVNFGGLAVHRTAVTSKAIIAEYYGADIQRNLFFGCSRGGGQALMLAQRSPDLFDGIYAGAPAYSWTREMAGRWTYNAMNMYPDPNQISIPVIDADAQALIGNAIMTQCDALDGLEDGILNDPRQCNFAVSSLQCGASVSNQCLSEEQVRVAQDLYREVEFGGTSWPGMPMGVELPGNFLGWSMWTTGGYVEGMEIDFHPGDEDGEAIEMPPIKIPNATWGFSTQLMQNFFYSDPNWTYEGYDFSDFAHHAARVGPMLDADDPDLSEFRERGGKLILDNGWMDGSLSAFGTIDYFEKVMDADPTAREDVRLFVRPGITHCRNGPGVNGGAILGHGSGGKVRSRAA